MLERVLLGEAGAHLGDGNVIVVPPGKLHAVPWGLLPHLRSRAVNVVPSAASWLRARRAAADGVQNASAGPVVLVRGPGLASEGAEVPQLAAEYAGDVEPVVLGDGTATAARVLEAIDGARLVHIAAHGTFRADSPLFSALQLDDGPLTVYDLERLRRGPRQLVLSSCDSGVVAPAGADEVLGLASSLIPLGTAAIVASVVPVNDAAVVPLMIALHRELRSGASLADALRDARQAIRVRPGGRGHGLVLHLPWLGIRRKANTGCGCARHSQVDPSGHHVGAVRRTKAQTKRAVRFGIHGEKADLVHRRRDQARLGMDFERSGVGRDDLAEQAVLGDLKLYRELGRAEGKSSDRRCLRPRDRGHALVAVRVVGELRELGIDVMPGEGVLPGLDEPRRDGLPCPHRLAQSR